MPLNKHLVFLFDMPKLTYIPVVRVCLSCVFCILFISIMKYFIQFASLTEKITIWYSFRTEPYLICYLFSTYSSPAKNNPV